MNVDGVLRKVAAELLALLLLQRIPCNDLERLLHIDGFLGRRFKVRDAALGLAESHGPLGRNDPLALLHVNLVAQHHKRERVWVARRRLDQELVTPRVERVKGLGVVDIKDEHAAVGATVKGHTKRLEALLSGRVPELDVQE